MRELAELMLASSEKGLKLQNKDGSMPEGHNGPWNDDDTPARNTAHWLITFLKAHKLTKKNKFLLAAKKAADYLISKKSLSDGKAFFCQRNSKNAFTNGLIGQAWVIESLAIASVINKKYGLVAEKVFLQHPFDSKLGLWKSLNLDGTPRNIHETFNQQLWFAVSGLLLSKKIKANGEISKRVSRFLERLNDNIETHRNGLIYHQIFRKKIYPGIRGLVYSLQDFRLRMSKHYNALEAGYHSFNLYAFAILRKECGLDNYPFWHSTKFKKLLSYVLTGEYRKRLRNNRYAFSYNPTGFEVAYALKSFEDILGVNNDKINRWIDWQIKRYYSRGEKLLCDGTTDKNTLAARIYEATRILD